jgi:hypothetical protein
MTQKPHSRNISLIHKGLDAYMLDALAMRVQSVNKSLELHTKGKSRDWRDERQDKKQHG